MTTGKGSNSQLVRIASKYNEIQTNGQILSNRRAMEIIWHRVEQLAERIDLNEAPERMAKIKSMWDEFRGLDRQEKAMEAALMARKIDDEFEAAYHDYMAWKQMFDALEIHQKMTESEVKIMKDMRAIITAEDATELVGRVMAVMLRILQDNPRKLKEARYELENIIGANVVGRLGGGRGEGGSGAGSGELDRKRILDSGDAERPEAEGTDEAGSVPEGRDQGDILA